MKEGFEKRSAAPTTEAIEPAENSLLQKLHKVTSAKECTALLGEYDSEDDGIKEQIKQYAVALSRMEEINRLNSAGGTRDLSQQIADTEASRERILGGLTVALKGSND